MKKLSGWMKAHAGILVSLAALVILVIFLLIIDSMENLSLETKFQVAVTTTITGILAYITFLYMRETKRMRKIAERALDIDVAPLVFMQKIDSTEILDEMNKKLTLYEILYVTNVGKSPAYDIEVSYRLVSEPVQFSWEHITSPHLYPTQVALFYVIPFSFTLTDREVEEIKNRMGKPHALVLFPMRSKPSFEIELKIKYLSLNNKQQQISYLCNYLWDSNRWGIITLKEDNEIAKL
jgi:hypothetical protein